MTQRQSRFGPLDITYDDAVLEPRPWTLEQSRWAATLLGDLPEGPVLELCAGAGQIGLVVAVQTGRSLVQVDVDPRACGHARSNAERARVRSDVRCGDLQEALAADERFPFVLADPPYIPSDEVDDLPGDPDDAIDGGPDGLDIARTCIAIAATHLVEGGLVVLQLKSPEQVDLLRPVVAEHGLEVREVRSVSEAGALALMGGDRSAMLGGSNVTDRSRDLCTG